MIEFSLQDIPKDASLFGLQMIAVQGRTAAEAARNGLRIVKDVIHADLSRSGFQYMLQGVTRAGALGPVALLHNGPMQWALVWLEPSYGHRNRETGKRPFEEWYYIWNWPVIVYSRFGPFAAGRILMERKIPGERTRQLVLSGTFMFTMVRERISIELPYSEWSTNVDWARRYVAGANSLQMPFTDFLARRIDLETGMSTRQQFASLRPSTTSCAAEYALEGRDYDFEE